MNSYRIIIEPFSIMILKKFKIIEKANEHILATVAGIISKENAEEWMKQKTVSQRVCIKLLENEKEEKILFQGLVKETSIKEEGAVYGIDLSMISFTYLMDQKKVFRTFQEKEQSYQKLVDEIVNENTSVICLKGNKKLGSLQIQYQETDWEFLKRMASQLNTVLVADATIDRVAFYFGLKDSEVDLNSSVHVCSVRDIITIEEQFREYELETDMFLHIGDKIVYNSMCLQVWGHKITLINQELINYYQLRAPGKCHKNRYENKNLIGVSLKGMVIRVRNEKLKITLDGDMGEHTKKIWFDYATVYSSSEGGWYCMPEEGEEIRLYFPGERAENAYVLKCRISGENRRATRSGK